MLNKFKTFNNEKKIIVSSSIIGIIGLIIILAVCIPMAQYGSIIGWVAGVLVNFLLIILLLQGTKYLLPENSNAGLFYLCYILRFVLMFGSMVLLAVFQFVMNFEIFNWSVITCTIAFLPTQALYMAFLKGE